MAPDNRCAWCGRPEINGYFECRCIPIPTKARIAVPLKVPRKKRDNQQGKNIEGDA